MTPCSEFVVSVPSISIGESWSVPQCSPLIGAGENGFGDRFVQVVDTPGHMCFWENERGHLFTGDLVYKDTLWQRNL